MTNIFNKLEIYNTIFFNIQSVTEYGSTLDFEKSQPEMFQTWLRMTKKRYNSQFENIQNDGNSYRKTIDELYLEKACFLPEFSKIVGITYATVKNGEDGSLKRELKYINSDDEVDMLIDFIKVLNNVYAEGHYSKPSFIPTMCGHNIIGHDIPLLVKRIIKHREILKNTFDTPILPLIIKHYLNCKPWESNVIDTINVWKFNGTDFISLNLVAELIDLKKTVTLKGLDEINELYWGVWKEGDTNTKEKMISTQSANFTNVALQFVNELRQI